MRNALKPLGLTFFVAILPLFNVCAQKLNIKTGPIGEMLLVLETESTIASITLTDLWNSQTYTGSAVDSVSEGGAHWLAETEDNIEWCTNNAPLCTVVPVNRPLHLKIEIGGSSDPSSVFDYLVVFCDEDELTDATSFYC